MKWTPFRVIVPLNILIHVGIFALAAISGGNNNSQYGTSAGWAVLLSGLFLIVANIVLAAITGIASSLMKGEAAHRVSSAAQAFILSAGIILLISVPMCLMSGPR